MWKQGKTAQMNRINPFDNLHFKQGIGQAGNVESPERVDKCNTPSKPDGAQEANSIPKTNEDDFVDMSDMVDDSGNFDTSDFNFDKSGDTDNVDASETENSEGQNQNNQNQDEVKEEVSQFVEDLLKKQN